MGEPQPSFAPPNSTPPQAYFIAVGSDKSAAATQGYWVIPSQEHWAHGVSGTGTLQKAPQGTWYSTSGATTTNEKGMVEKTKEGTINHKVQFGILKKGAVAPPSGLVDPSLLTRNFYDKKAKRNRNGIAGHVDGMEGTGKEGNAGTAGCFGVRDSPALVKKGAVVGPQTGSVDPGMLLRHQNVMKDVFAKPGVPLQVEHYPTKDAVEARVQELTRDYDFFNRPLFMRLESPGATATPSLAGPEGAGTFELTYGRPDVLVGIDGNPLAFAAPPCLHQGGGSVKEGSKSVRVGVEQFEVGRELDPTTDGLLLESDVEFLRIGD